MTSRYSGRPFLRFLEWYVLWAIGELSDSDTAALEELTPMLQKTYGSYRDWHEIVASVMEFPSTLPASLQQMWARDRATACRRQQKPSAQAFAEMVVDENLTG